MLWSWKTRVAQLETYVAKLTGEVAGLEKIVHELSARIERGSTTGLRADLDSLVSRVETLATSNRREFGKLHAAKAPAAEHEPLHGPDGDDLAQTIAFQRQWSNGHGET